MGWRPVDVVVTCIALSFVAVMLSPVVRVVVYHDDLGEHQIDTIEELLMGALAIISLYVGAALQRRKDKDE